MAKACVNTVRCSINLGELAVVKKEVVICNVYAPNVEEERVVLWEFILANQRKFSVPWIVGGDFNVVADVVEKQGGTPVMSNLIHFQKHLIQKQTFPCFHCLQKTFT